MMFGEHVRFVHFSAVRARSLGSRGVYKHLAASCHEWGRSQSWEGMLAPHMANAQMSFTSAGVR